MNVMSAMKRWLHFAGLLPRRNEHFIVPIIKRVICAVFVLETIIPLSIYLQVKELNLFKIAAALYSLSMFSGMFIQFMIYVYRAKELKLLIDDLTEWVQQQHSLQMHKYFEIVEQKTNRVMRFFERFTLLSYVLFVLAPAATQYQAYRSGAVTNETYEASFNDMYYFFETTHSPLYEIFYAAYALGVLFVMVVFFSKGFLFVTLCFYFVAMYDDLKAHFREMDWLADVQDRLKLHARCVRIHNQIYRFTERANRLMSEVIFIQLMYGLFTLTMQVFYSTFVDTSKKLGLVINFGSLCGELFVFCWAGQIVLDEADNVNACVYNLKWYNYTLIEQKNIWHILIRQHRPMGLRALNYIPCNLSTFYWIMKKVFSALAFLQSME